MTTLRSLLLAAALLGGAALHANPPAPAADPATLEHGRYLVERAILCIDCHSPRNEKGEYIKEHWLMGAALPFKPTVEMPWADVAPPLAGLPSMTDEQSVRFLMAGTRPDGTHARAPMPEFRFNETDARAITAYLRSLRPAASAAAAATP